MFTRFKSRQSSNRFVQIGLLIIILSCYYALSLPHEDGSTKLIPQAMTRTSSDDKHNVPTLRPRRMNCTALTIEQFPVPLLPQSIRVRGGIAIHIMVAIFAFLGLTIVCDEYFLASLERICEELKLSPDVAGATFMAAGSSAPMFATMIIGEFIAKDDIGVSNIIGSSLFNISFVLSVCALCSGTVLQLNWWPLLRDCSFYCLSIIIMFVVILNGVISWHEALFMLICYAVYCLALHFSSRKPIGNSFKINYRSDPIVKPESRHLLKLIKWYIAYPIHCMCRKTMPDVRKEENKNWYPLTFIISMIWISFYSYFMVWMITIVGFTLGIPDKVMGYTFLAAALIVPNILNSIAVAKEGFGVMVVSNALGSNVLNILVCLGLPRFIQTALISPGSHVNVISQDSAYSTRSLLLTVFFLFFAIYMNSWKLDKKLGVILMFWYILFATLASLYELNLFSYMFPPECPSNY